jgi:hypothetical protein
MIFNKILKRFDLEFDIVLDKEKYKGGELVKGILTIITKQVLKVRGLMLIA